jgi:hypothetical protein
MEHDHLWPLTGRTPNTNFWQILQFKSAHTEGLLASFILTCAQEENLSLGARLFFSTQSPLEEFLPEIPEFNRPLSTNLGYLEERARLLSFCRGLQAKFQAETKKYQYIENIKWLLRFQLYGFADACFKKGKILFSLLALKEAELLDREPIKGSLLHFSQENPSYRNLIEEFIS